MPAAASPHRGAVHSAVHYEGWSHFKQGRQPIEHELEGAPADESDRWVWAPIGDPLRIDV